MKEGPKLHRYPGAQPFSSRQGFIFFGRDHDIEQLYQLINLEKLTVLYSKSGLGKSSLLNAGVLPKFRQAGDYTPISIRAGAHARGMEDTLSDRIKRSIAPGPPENPIVEKIWPGEDSLWTYLKHDQIRTRNRRKYLLVLDQFEEVFTYPDDQLKVFKEELAELLFVDIPQRLRERIEAGFEGSENFLSEHELETLHSDLDVKVVIAIRSDRVSLLNKLTDQIPNVLKKMYELQPLTPEQAEEAILNPAYEPGDQFFSPLFDYEHDAIEAIIDYLTQGGEQKIESFQLQILCQAIEEKVAAQQIRKVKLEHIGSFEHIYENYYDDQIAKLPSQAEQEAARIFIEEGLVLEEEQRRLTLYEGQILKDFNVDRSLLRKLVDTHLLRAEPSGRGGYVYELSHDTLVGPILKAKARRLEAIEQKREKEKQLRQEQELKAANDQVRRQRFWLVFISLLGGIALLASIYAFLAGRQKNLALERERETKINSILNFAYLNLDENPTLSFRLAEAAQRVHGENMAVRKAILSAYNRSNTVQFYNSFYDRERQIHRGEINSVVFSPDDRRLVTAADDGLVVVWNLAGEIEHVLRGHEGAVTMVRFSPDGRRLVSAAKDGEARIWDLENPAEGQPTVLRGHSGAVNSVFFSPDGDRVLTAGDDRLIIEWSLGGQILHRIDEARGEVLYANYWPDGKQIYAFADKVAYWLVWEEEEAQWKSIRAYANDGHPTAFNFLRQDSIWININNGNQLLGLRSNPYSPITFEEELVVATANSDKSLIAVATAGNDILLRSSSGKTIRLTGHEARINHLVFSPAPEGYLVSSSDDQTVRLWDQSGVQLQVLKGHNSYQTQVRFSHNGRFLATSVGNELRLWHFKERKIRVFNHHAGPVTYLQFDETGKGFLSSSLDGKVVYQPLTGPGRAPSLFAHGSPVRTAKFNRDASRLLAAAGDSVFIWNPADTTAPVKVFEEHIDQVSSADFSDDGLWVLSADLSGDIYEWQVRGADRTKTRARIKSPIYQILDIDNVPPRSDRFAFAPNSKEFNRVFIIRKSEIDAEGIRTLQEAENIPRVSMLIGHKEKINAVNFSGDGELAVTASDDKTAILWDRKGRILEIFRGHIAPVLYADFSADEHYIITASEDKSIRIWEIESGTELLVIDEHQAPVASAIFSPDDRFVLSGSTDGIIRIKPIELDVNSILDRVNNKKDFGNVRQLTAEEMQEYGITEPE